MTLTRKLLALSAAAALSFCFTACDDDSGDSNTKPSDNKCTAAQNTCKSDTVASVCDASGEMKDVTCTGDEKCVDGACKVPGAPEPEKCTAAQNTCKSDTVASQCDEATGEMKDVTCTGDEKCVSGICIKAGGTDPNTPVCEKGTYACDGHQLMKCKDDGTGYDLEKDCEAPTPKCDAEAKACVAECEASEKSCLSSKARKYCDNGAIKTEDCADGKTCDGGECKAECENSFAPVCDGDRIKKCEGGKFTYTNCQNDQKCDTDKVECVTNVVEVKKDSVIGTPCKCEGDDCTFKITGKEIKAALNTKNIKLATFMPDQCGGLGGAIKCGFADIAISTIVSNYLKKIPDDGYVEAPNFFSKASQAACSNVKAPEGMVVGCLRDTKIDFSHLNFTNEKGDGLLDEIGPTLDTILGLDLSKIDPNIDINEALKAVGGKDGVLKILDEVKVFAKDGIEFTSPNGYCLTADIEIKLTVADDMINSIIDMKKVDPMLAKINTTGTDHSKAKNATCPDGSTLLWYDISDGGGAEDMGEAQVGFDMCLKACANDDDCKREGVTDNPAYKCLELPYGTAEDVAAKSKTAHVCFDETNMTYFEGITKKFEELIPKTEGSEAAEN